MSLQLVLEKLIFRDCPDHLYLEYNGLAPEHFKEDDAMVPDYFKKTAFLERSVADMAKFEKQKKLPLISDILANLFNATDADYLIYTNNDIILQPFFYRNYFSLQVFVFLITD